LRLSFAEKVSAAMRASLRPSPASPFKFGLIILFLLLMMVNGTIGLAALTVTGTVFRDYDGDGIQDSTEPGIPGITITGYDSTGTSVSTTTSTAAATIGQYTLNYVGAATELRVEVTNLPIGYQAGFAATPTSDASIVRFVATGNNVANFGIMIPRDFCQNPQIVTSCFIPSDNSISNTNAIVYFDYFANARNGAFTETSLALGNQVGTTYGLAFQYGTESLFAGSYVRRGTSQGASNSTGTIYRISNVLGARTVSTFLELNGFAGIDTGANPHPNGTNTPDFWITDPAGFAAVGRRGLGDMEISEDERTLYTINLFQRELIVLPLDSAGTNPTAPTAGQITRVAVPTPANCPAADVRPFALKYDGGTLYVGMICSGESALATILAGNATPTFAQIAAARAALRAYVYTFNPATNTFGSAILDFPLDYPRGQVNDGFPSAPGNDGEWLPWNDQWRPSYIPTRTGLIANPQPILTDIEFDNLGYMMIGFRDRFADQAFSAGDISPAGGQPGIQTRQGGDLLLACINPTTGVWSLENAGTCEGRSGTTQFPTASPQQQGPGGAEFFSSERYNPFHEEIALGGLGILPGSGEIVTSVYDSWDTFENGTHTYNISDASLVRRAQVFPPNSLFQKGGGLGDVEFICDRTPIEVGNRIWNDVNRNGIQDPGEAPLPGVTVELRTGAGALIRSAVTDANGNYYFSSREGTSSTSAIYGITQLLPNTSYQVVIPLTQTALAGYTLTEADDSTPTPGGSDRSDSDFMTSGSNAVIPFTTGGIGANNHTFDGGFYAFDRGDLPDTAAGVGAGNYETLLANSGASHVIVTGLRMGATVDAEANGQPNAAANGDDTTGSPDDEDGVTVADLTLTQGSPANVRVTATNTTGSPATLYGFIDFNGDGDFGDTNETTTIAVPTGSNDVEFTLAFGTVPFGSAANTYARFRLSTQTGLTANGIANDGEVEDYPVVINVLTDRGDLPDTGAGTGIDNYETLVASGGASHTIVAGLLMGTSVDGETNGQPNAAANGDDTTGSPDDEDGVTVADLTLTQGSPANVRVRATNTTGSPATLYGFIDFNGDGDFLDANETATIAVPTGSSNVEFTLPFGTVPLGSDASTYARFRLSNQAGLTANGASTSGEVEDYPVIINPVSDRGDLPDTGAGVGAGNYETLILNGAPSHVIVPGLRMGAFVDGEANGQPNAAANGDDTTGSPDDEDGVTVADLTLTQGSPANVRVRATNTTGSPATLYGFIDFNGDGDFDDTNETATIAVPTGSNNVEFTLPFGTAPLGGATATYARFRLSNETGLTANGASTSGEVEDYPVTTIPASDRGDLPDTGAGVGATNYETLLASGGASHTIVAGLRMGTNIDSEANGQPNAAADGDDTNQSPDDEDGVTVADLTLTQGSPANVRVTATNTTGSPATLYGFIDFNGDGDFSDPNETATIAVPTGSNDVEFTLAFGTVPIGSVVSSYARFRLSNQVGLTANGASTSGEVEDYPITTTPTFDRGDLPDTGAGVSAGNYETLLANGGASHAIISGLLMGATVDSEADGQPNVAASGDDTTGSPDDEDGVTVADLTLTQGAPANVRVRVTNTTAQAATLYGFMDFNGDGDFGDANETATLIVPVGTNNAEVTLAFGNVPFGSAANTYARFRLSNQASLTANGASTSGEVEDYPVVIAPVVDRGDLPDTAAGIGAGNYETLDANGGPSHTIVGGLRLGTNIDGESNGFPSATANGDDTNQTPDDEDGVTVADLVLTQGGPANVRVRATNTTGSAATLYGFIDFNGDGDFTDPGESVTVAVPTGSNNVQFTLPFGTVPAGSAASTYARFRLSTQGGLTANGAAPDGEIEDYPVTITGSTFDRGDLPDTAAGVSAGNYETLLANGGASHQIVPGIRMGTTVDAEADGQPNAAANGDDTTGSPDDEDGVTVADLTLTQGNLANVRVRATNTTGSAATLYGFIDFNGDGDFGDASETTTVIVPNGSNNVEFTLAFGNVPAGSAANSYARFRLSTQTGLIATGNASDGEVEDYPVIVNAAVDRGDLPDTTPGVSAGNYETIDGNGGPSHPIVAGLRMGATVDGEANGQPNAAANGDDTTGTPDDEDGVTVADLTLTQGSPASVRVSVTNTTGGAATLFGFIDFNGDGDFSDPGETTTVAVPDGSSNATVTLAFGNVPAGSAASTYARFRLSTDLTLGATGAATNGEVEDYPVTINAAGVDRGDLPDTSAGVGAGNYETTTASGGPSHPIVPGLRLGTNIDGEGDGQPNGTATGDDSGGTPDDEDGITIADLSLVQGSPANVRATVTNTTGSAATLFGFIDFNGDGDFTDPGETTSVAVPNGSTNAAVTLAFGNVPADSAPATFARFRLSTDASLTASGAATNGEVEDYPVAISGGGVDRGDLPDTTAGLGAGDYQTLDVNTGPSHPIVAGLRMGATVDGEADGQPNTVANGDDTTGTPDDEDGVTIADLSLTTGALANVRVRATNTTGTAATLYGFIDFNGDGDFSDPGEAATIAVPTGSSDVEFSLPFGSVPAGSAANTYARFRLSTQTGLTATDAATDGEVEDYPVSITSGTLSLGNRVWNDGDNSGTLNGEPGIDGVTVELYRDSNSDGVPDGPAIRTTTTAGGGYYLFDTLPPGTYLVGIPASNFQGAAPLVNFRSSTGAGQEPNPESSGDSNDNGLDATDPTASGILSAPVILSAGGEPINEIDNGGAGSGSATNPDSNLTVDFGFFQPPPGTLSLGNRVWIDTDNSGTINGSEVGRPGVRLSLYEDADRNGVPDGAPIARTTTDGSGYYLFVGLQPGEYVVGVDAANFQAGGALPGSTSSTGTGQEADPEAEGDSNDNGIDNADPAANGILSGTVILSLGAEPQGEIDLGSGDGGVGNANSNLTVDFGFSTPLAQPPPPTGQPGPRVADPTIVKLVDPAFAQPGEDVTFIITVTNPNAIPLDSVIFTDIVPNQFTVLGATASAGTVTVNGQTVSYFFQTMPPLSSFEVRINTRVRLDVVPPLTVDNVATLGGIYSGQARATVTIGTGTGDVLELPATGETPWWRTPALLSGLTLLLLAGYALLRKRHRTPSIAQE
jgi:uncharacterized repeat protein (TIGR01451 family)